MFGLHLTHVDNEIMASVNFLPGEWTERVHRRAVRALTAALHGADVTRVVRVALRAAGFSSAERAAFARGVIGASIMRRRCAALVDEPLRRAPADALLLAYFFEHDPSMYDALRGRLNPADTRRWEAALGRTRAWDLESPTGLATALSVPDWLATLLTEERGVDDARACLATMNRPGPITVRANRLRTTRDGLAQALDDEGIRSRTTLLAPDALFLIGRPNIRNSRPWRRGWFEVQDAGSQIIARAVGARPGERVLDLCAGAGGKTLALAAAMRNRGEIVACDIDAKRLANLRARLRRGGVENVRVVRRRTDPDKTRGALPTVQSPGAFDRVLVDAPCSALGTLRRSPALRWAPSPDLQGHAAVQLALLRDGASMVRPGGVLVYATCSLSRVENEDVAEAFLSSSEGRFRPWRLPLSLSDGARLRLSPERHDTDGFFLAGFLRG